MQFGIYRRSPILKYVSQLLTTIAIAIFIEVIGVNIVCASHIAHDHFSNNLGNHVAHSEEDDRAVELGLRSLRIFFFVCIPLQLCYPIQTLLDVIFRNLTGRAYGILSFDCFLNFAVMLTMFLILTEFNYDILKYNEQTIEDVYEMVHCARYCSYSSIYYAAFTACVWLRVLYLLRLNRILGPLLKIIFHMTKDILKFVFLLILIILTFACIGNIEFNVPEFYTFHQSIITLYSWMLGEFSFDVMEPEGAMGIVFIAIYLLLNLILLLNFVIAIISSTYSRLEAYGVGLYL